MAGLADTKGHLTKTYQYIVTGERAYGSATYENEYTYNGESYNPNIHSQYLRARYYSVVTASFLTEDSYLGNIREPLTLNRYNYCISNYMNYEDPSGNIIGSLLVTCAVVGGVIGLVVGVGSEVYRALETDNYNWTEGVCNVITDAASGVVGGITCAVTGGNPVAVGLTTGMVHGFLDGIVHIDSTKGVEENASNIVTGSAREGFIGLMYGAGFEFAAMCVGNTSLPVLAKLFIMGANGGATAGTTSRYLSGDEVTAETIAGDAVIGGISTLVLNELARAIQWKMTAGPELPEGYIRDRANSVAKLNASKQCEAGKTPVESSKQILYDALKNAPMEYRRNPKTGAMEPYMKQVQITDEYKVLFRRDVGDFNHGDADHWNLEIQTQRGNTKYDLHLYLGEDGNLLPVTEENIVTPKHSPFQKH